MLCIGNRGFSLLSLSLSLSLPLSLSLLPMLCIVGMFVADALE
jgi:hypothetical protein